MQQKDIAAFSPYEDLNTSLDQNYFAAGKRAALCGAEKDLAKMLPGFESDAYPAELLPRTSKTVWM